MASTWSTEDDPEAKASPDDPTRLERHGTQLAGLLVGSEGPAARSTASPAERRCSRSVSPAGQRESRGRWAVPGRTDQLVAGLERAVDPNADGVAHDAVRVALVGVASRSPRSRTAAAAGGRRSTPAPHARRHPGEAATAPQPRVGSISGRGGSRAALTVGAADLVTPRSTVHLVLRTGLGLLRPAGSPRRSGRPRDSLSPSQRTAFERARSSKVRPRSSASSSTRTASASSRVGPRSSPPAPIQDTRRPRRRRPARRSGRALRHASGRGHRPGRDVTVPVLSIPEATGDACSTS